MIKDIQLMEAQERIDLTNGGIGRMKRNSACLKIMAVIFCVALMFMAGCSKKTVTKSEDPVAKEQKAAAARAEAEARELAERKLAEEREAQQKGSVKELALRRDAEAAAASAAAASAAEKNRKDVEDIYFGYDKAAIEPEARIVLKKLADLLAGGGNYSLVIEGHCDERGTVEYNLALGQRRADAAMKYLVDLGVDRGSITTVSYGKERPVDSGQNEEAWARNRRAHFLVTGK
jgi:peptidoglycan-associated lipoprotein